MSNIKSKIGPLLLFVFSFMPLFIWLIVRAGTYSITDFSSLTYSLGQVFALVGTSMFALTLILSTRMKKIEDYFNGLDKMYFYHHLLGALAFILVLFHPLLLVLKFIPSNIQLAAKFLLPGSSWAYNFGIIALFAMIILIILTFFAKIRYQNWKISHKFMGLVFIIACFHIFLVKTDITYYPILKNYMLSLCSLGIISFAYSSFLRPEIGKTYDYLVESVNTEKKSITIITMKPLKEHLKFIAGQFIFIKLISNKISQEQHPFTIASSPREDGSITIAVKSLGDFTSNLKNISKGTAVEIEGPYGRFSYKKHESQPQIWIAGGIGVTPFLSKIGELSKTKRADNKIDLYYCVKNKEEAVFLDELNQNITNLRVIPYYSEQHGRITADKIISLSKPSPLTHIFICGPPVMSESLRKDFKNKGIPKKNIHYEEFNLK